MALDLIPEMTKADITVWRHTYAEDSNPSRPTDEWVVGIEQSGLDYVSVSSHETRDAAISMADKLHALLGLRTYAYDVDGETRRMLHDGPH